MWPTIAASPAAAGAAAFPLNRAASITLAAPFVMSRIATRMPAVIPAGSHHVRRTEIPAADAAQIDGTQRRASSSAKGIDPIKYAVRIRNPMHSADAAALKGLPCE